MSSGKDKLALALGTAGVLMGAMTFFQPPSPDPNERARQQSQNQAGDLAESHERELQRYRAAGEEHADAENARRLTPGEHRPPAPHVRIRVIP